VPAAAAGGRLTGRSADDIIPNAQWNDLGQCVTGNQSVEQVSQG